MIETFFKIYALLGIAWAVLALARFCQIIGRALAGKPLRTTGLTKVEAAREVAKFDPVASKIRDVSELCPRPVLAIILAILGIIVAIWDGMWWPFSLWKTLAKKKKH